MIHRLKIIVIVLLVAAILAGAVLVIANAAKHERLSGQTFVVAYREFNGTPWQTDDSTYLKFKSNSKADLYFDGATYTIGDFKAVDGTFTARLIYVDRGEGRDKGHYDIAVSGTYDDGVLIFDRLWDVDSLNSWKLVFVEEQKFAQDQAKPYETPDVFYLDPAVVGIWRNIDTYQFMADGTGSLIDEMVPDRCLPFTWIAKDGVLEISYTEYLPAHTVKKYDFVDAADGHFLRLYDLDQDPDAEPFLHELFRKTD